MTTSTVLYRAIFLELERRRLAVGVTMAQLDDAAGVQDGYYPKMLWSDTPSGRVSRWETVQLIVDALYPAGFDLIMTPKPMILTEPSMRSKIRFAAGQWDRKLYREQMREIGRKGGVSRTESLTKEERESAAQHAINTRWRRHREKQRQET